MTTFALIGSGFRARMFLDVARGLGTVRCGGVVVRTPRRLDVPTFTSLDACLRELRPDFVLTATPRSVTPGVIADAVDRGLPVLAETPPAPDLDGLRALWSAVGASGLVQVAEQYLMMPSHAARAALVATGAIGTPTQVQVSSTQQYHAVSLIRGLLGAGRGPVSVRATRFTAPLVSPLSRAGWTDDEEAAPDDHDDRDPRLRGRTLGGVRLHRAADAQPAAVPAAHRYADRRASCTTTRWCG